MSPLRQALAIALGGFVLRLGWLLFTRPVPVSDYEKYRSLAADLLHHHQLGFPEPSALRLPVYPGFLALGMAIHPSAFWLSLANVLVSALVVGLVYGVAYRATSGDRRTSAGAALLCALYPTYVFFSPVLASEHLFTALLLASLFFLARPGGAGGLGTLAAGLSMAAAVLTRGEGVFQVLTCLVVAVFRPASRRKGTATALLVLLPVVVFGSAWVFRNGVEVGRGAGLSTTGGTNFYMAHNAGSYGYRSLEETPLDGLPELEAQKLGYRLGLEYLRENPLRLVRDAALGTKELYRPAAYGVRISVRIPKAASSSTYPERPLPGRRLWAGVEILGYLGVCLLAFAGLLRARSFPAWATVIPLSILAMNWLCYAVFFWANSRYRYPADAALCLLGGLGLSAWRSASRRS